MGDSACNSGSADLTSRLYVGVHYPTDVLGGAVVGVLAAWGAVRIVKRREIKGNREG